MLWGVWAFDMDSSGKEDGVSRGSPQSEAQHVVRVGGPTNLPQTEREKKLDYLASSWCFSYLQ